MNSFLIGTLLISLSVSAMENQESQGYVKEEAQKAALRWDTTWNRFTRDKKDSALSKVAEDVENFKKVSTAFATLKATLLKLPEPDIVRETINIIMRNCSFYTSEVSSDYTLLYEGNKEIVYGYAKTAMRTARLEVRHMLKKSGVVSPDMKESYGRAHANYYLIKYYLYNDK